jgi:hypothetical protein
MEAGRLVFVDETAARCCMNRLYGWAISGTTPVIKRSAHGKRLSIVGAIAVDGLRAHMTYTGSIRGTAIPRQLTQHRITVRHRRGWPRLIERRRCRNVGRGPRNPIEALRTELPRIQRPLQGRIHLRFRCRPCQTIGLLHPPVAEPPLTYDPTSPRGATQLGRNLVEECIREDAGRYGPRWGNPLQKAYDVRKLLEAARIPLERGWSRGSGLLALEPSHADGVERHCLGYVDHLVAKYPVTGHLRGSSPTG